MLVDGFAHYCRCKTSKAICLGSYITRQVKGMDFFHGLPLMQVMCGLEHLTLQVLRKMKVLVVCGNRVVLLGVEDEEEEHSEAPTT